MVIMLMNEKPILARWIIELLEEAGNRAFEIMIEQMKINPDAIEALYGD
jgi:hypothetical protein